MLNLQCHNPQLRIAYDVSFLTGLNDGRCLRQSTAGDRYAVGDVCHSAAGRKLDARARKVCGESTSRMRNTSTAVGMRGRTCPIARPPTLEGCNQQLPLPTDGSRKVAHSHAGVRGLRCHCLP